MEGVFATRQEQFQSCESPFSFYTLTDHLMRGGNPEPLRRLCTLMRKMRAKSFLQEVLIPNQELLDEQRMAEEALQKPVNLEATRLTFFCLSEGNLSWGDIDKLESSLLAYAVIVTLQWEDQTQPYLLEAVVRPPSVVFPDVEGKVIIEPITNYYVHNVREFTTVIGSEEQSANLKIKGSFFSQQNAMTSCCAHAALRSAINSSPLIEIPKLTNKFINDTLRISSQRYGQDLRLHKTEIEQVVKALSCGVHAGDFTENTQTEYDLFLYPALESRCPTILGIQGWNNIDRKYTSHVVTVLGHTTNSDRWDPQARSGYGNYPIQPYISSANWCDHYVISDDNYGVYGTLPSDMLRNFIVPSKNPNLHATFAVCIVPQIVAMPGYFAEQVAMVKARELIAFVQLPNIWLKRMQIDDLVCRTILQTRTQYRDYFARESITINADQEKYFQKLSEYIWVSEISLPNLYTGNKRKLGDVVIRANASPQEHYQGRSLALAWFPGFIQLGNTPNLQEWPITSHVPIIRNGNRPLLEW